MLAGIEWIIDARGCDHSRLQDLTTLQALCGKVVAELGLKVVGEPQWHKFPFPGGVTGLYLLSESHLACHTYPEYQLATLNLYCCRERESWDWKGALTDHLCAKTVDIRRLARGYCPDAVAGLQSNFRTTSSPDPTPSIGEMVAGEVIVKAIEVAAYSVVG